MAPAPIIESIVDTIQPKKDTLDLPYLAHQRLTKADIDLSGGYPYRPAAPLYLQDVYKIRNDDRPYEDAGARADKQKKHLLSAATKVTDLTTHIGTEIEGLQLKDLTPEQRDELALLIGERSVVFFRNQEITPQQQKELGEWFGEVEIHVSTMESDVTGCRYSLVQNLMCYVASGAPGPWRAWCHRHMAGPLCSGKRSQLPQARWRFIVARRPRARTAARRDHTPTQ
jgi:hypothetical protein